MKRSLDLREQSLWAVAGGMSRSQVCAVFGIHQTTLRRWQGRQEAALLAPLPSAGAKRKLGPDDEECLRLQLQAYPDATVNEHLRRWQEEQDVPVSRATLGRTLLRVNWTRKKERESPGTGPASASLMAGASPKARCSSAGVSG